MTQLLFLTAASLFFSAAQASINLLVYDSMGCEGSILANARNNPGAPQEGSGCVASNIYQSVGVLSADPGFQCNLYSDPGCQNFMSTVSAGGLCTNVIGQGVICFSQAQFDNPFAGTVAQVQVGTNILTVDRGGGFLVQSGVNQACGDRGCDPTNVFSKPFRHFNKDCTLTVQMAGNYGDTNQRDYIVGLLRQAYESATTNVRADLRQSAADDNLVRDVPSFVQVVIDRNGNNQAEMSVSMNVACNPPSKGLCDDAVSGVTSAALGAVPSVGGVLAVVFEITCAFQ
ncbi:hypothetical protein TWF696_000499 [Orbilia brochopaga]|uniref:Uncharacterized protein n=1 Tax=Orbilia brochopaga TaxID=3140254 RepID=A0AAV9VCQ4_9PEZI